MRLNSVLNTALIIAVAIVSLQATQAQDKNYNNGVDKAERKRPVTMMRPLPPNVEAGGGLGPQPKEKVDKAGLPVLGDFLLMPVEGSPVLYNFALLDKSSRLSVTSMYNLEQLRVFEAVMTEAQLFAQNDQNVGRTAPMITRFSSDEERGFVVDVSKTGKSSQYFITMKSRSGRVTLDSGTIKRGEAVPHGILFEGILLSLRKALEPDKEN